MASFSFDPWVQPRELAEPLSSDEATRRQARRIELARKQFLREFCSSAIGAPQEALACWRQEGKVFAVAHQKVLYFPDFQLDEKGQPRPVIARVIQVLGETSEWGLALWFTASSGWLDGKRPVDLLDSAPEEVVEAAERSAEELVF